MLLGVEILFGKILVIGLPGIFVAWVVTPVVFILTYLFGQYLLRISSKSLNLTLSADMSVCGVSAAIATAAACRAKKEELTLAVGISLIFTSIMMIALPNVIQMLGMDPVLGGAWIGGTIDATGAVAAAGAFLGDQALYVAATIKMIQNILIGVIAFCVAVFWVTRVERAETGEKPSAWEIWRRFPKFVLGFLAASIAFSVLYDYLGNDLGETLISNGLIKGWTKTLRGWFFCLAFVSIGLATDFRSPARLSCRREAGGSLPVWPGAQPCAHLGCRLPHVPGDLHRSSGESMRRPDSPSETTARRWIALALGLAATAAIVFTLATAFHHLQGDFARVIEDRGLEPDALFYTETDEVAEAFNYLTNSAVGR